jgi:hypothetical protein
MPPMIPMTAGLSVSPTRISGEPGSLALATAQAIRSPNETNSNPIDGPRLSASTGSS